MIRTIRDVETALIPYAQRVAAAMGRDSINVENTLALAVAVGSPHEKLRVVHVAGTSGKTSTSYYTSSLLVQAGQCVGLTVSPHIVSIAERVMINGKSLDEQRFVGYFNEFISIVETSGLEPTYFQCMMVFALWVFERENVDYAVVETGFGGLHDSSNICRRSDKFCVITDIGFDHMHILGNTLEQIASQKAGIIAAANNVVMYEQSPEIMQPVYDAVSSHGATLWLAPTQPKQQPYLERNAALARFAYQQLARRDGLAALTDEQQGKVAATKIPGRLEVIELAGTQFVLDGAHNEQKMSTLFLSLKLLKYNTKSAVVVLAMKSDKQLSSVCCIVEQATSEVVVSEFTHGQDMPAKPVPAGQLAEFFAKSMNVSVAPKLAEVLRGQLGGNQSFVLVTGSLYAVAEARALLLEWGGRVQ